MKRIIDLLRLSAKILLALVVMVMVSGFLTAKPALLGGSFATYRWLHTRLVPLVFLPVLLLHTTTGLLFLVSRSKRWNTPWIRRAVVGGWLLVGVLLATLYFVNPRPAPFVAPEAEPIDATVLGEDGGSDDTTAQPGTTASDSASVASAATTDASSSPSVAATAQPRPSDSPSSLAPPPSPPKPNASSSPSAPPASPTTAALDSNKVVQAKCTGCHGLDQVYGEKRSTAEWNEVLDRMIGLGAELNAAERAAVMRVMPRR